MVYESHVAGLGAGKSTGGPGLEPSREDGGTEEATGKDPALRGSHPGCDLFHLDIHIYVYTYTHISLVMGTRILKLGSLKAYIDSPVIALPIQKGTTF